jgi:hypothetical protein
VGITAECAETVVSKIVLLTPPGLCLLCCPFVEDDKGN